MRAPLLAAWLAFVACGGSRGDGNAPPDAGVVDVDGAGDAGATGMRDAPVAQPDHATPDAPSSPVLARIWGGRGTEPGQFIEPSSIELDSSGRVYVAGHEDRVQRFTSDGDLLEIWGTPGAGDAQFNHPHGLAIDRRRGDIIYVGDQENRRVQAFTVDTTFIRAWVDDGFQHIHDVGIDPATGDIFVGDYAAHIVQKFTADGRWLLEFGGAGTGEAQFDGVWGISTDSRRNVYVADTGNRRIQVFDSNGTFLSVWNGTATPAGSFTKPTGIFVDSNDVVYVCDSLAQTILLFDTAGKFLESWNLRSIVGIDTEPEDVVVDATGTKI